MRWDHLYVGTLFVCAYRSRIKDLMQVHAHMLNTGDGGVAERSLWSDYVYGEALYRLGYWDKPAIDWRRGLSGNSKNVFLKPHVMVYMDCPADVVLENVRKHGKQYEV